MCTFLDLRVAFDSVPREEIWDALKRNKVPSNLIKTIKSVYKEHKGVKQGDSLSPLLFITFIDEILKICKRRTPRKTVGYRNLFPIFAQVFVFADDLVLIADSKENVQKSVIKRREELFQNGMEINAAKSKVMLVGRNEEASEITCNGELIELQL